MRCAQGAQKGEANFLLHHGEISGSCVVAGKLSITVVTLFP